MFLTPTSQASSGLLLALVHLVPRLVAIFIMLHRRCFFYFDLFLYAIVLLSGWPFVVVIVVIGEVPVAMAYRGRRGVPARGDEQRREEIVEPRRGDQGEQQAPASQGPAQAPVPQVLDHGGPSIMEKFKRMAPPSFKGESDPLLAESWMREIGKIFRAIRCAEDNKVTLATYMLKERADVWWSSLLRTWFEDGAIKVAWDKLVAFDHRTLDEALSEACQKEGEMEQYLEEKKASQKRPATPFQRQEKKKAAY
ncbi:hypothetical protein Taro_040017 [Colocasia esculenta]|uniref:Retrotransposon gag domain-containing protein n=1 Tax=Colocasia esculenta TaxID=4460 RepID=A0A843WXB6_COLES|nr:hypothetical protein [Colocasia esculenta]